MNINRENYGQFIIDYYDGQLSSKEERELLLFLDRHPALKEEFESFEEVPVLPDEPLEFSEKHNLQKTEITAVGTVNEDNYSEYFVLMLDDELTREEQYLVKNFLQQNPQLQEQFRLFGMTKVIPNEVIVFENKEQLRKRRPVFLLRYAGWAVAAVLLLLFGIRFFLAAPKQKTERSQLAVENIPSKSMRIALTKVSPQLIRESKIVVGSLNLPVQESHPLTKQQPVEILASADIYEPLKPEKDYAPLRFPDTRKREEIMALSLPVVVQKPERNGFLRHTIGKPFSQLATVFALQKKKRKTYGIRDKGFVRVLQSGVDAMNALTDNDVVMVKTYDTNGNLIDYQLLSDNFSINRPVKAASMDR